MLKKIHICGIYGCGKSALAKKLSKSLDIPYYSLDDIKYKIKYCEIRPIQERINIVKKICRKEKWITEGTWSNYAEEAFKKADLIILIRVPIYTSCYRILKRFLKRKKEKGDNLIGALKLMLQVYNYYKNEEPVSFKAHKNLIQKYKKRVIILKNNREIANFFNQNL